MKPRKKTKTKRAPRRDVARLEFARNADGMIQVHLVRAKDDSLNTFAAFVNGALYDSAKRQGKVPVRVAGKLIMAEPATLTDDEISPY